MSPSLAQYTVPTIATEIAVHQNCDISLGNGCISIFYKWYKLKPEFKIMLGLHVTYNMYM